MQAAGEARVLRSEVVAVKRRARRFAWEGTPEYPLGGRGRTPLFQAAEEDNVRVAEYLLHHGAPVDEVPLPLPITSLTVCRQP